MRWLTSAGQKLKEWIVSIRKTKKRNRRRLYVTILAIFGFWALVHFYWPETSPDIDAPYLSYTEFIEKVERNEVKEVKISWDKVTMSLKDGTILNTRVDFKFESPVEKLREHGVTIVFVGTFLSPDVWLMRSYVFLGIITIVVVWGYFFFFGIGPLGEIYLKFWQPRAKRYRTGEDRVTFTDVAGIDEAKAELQEIVDFLKNPKKFQRLGSRIPKGVLLIGSPGVGKTLLARAVAGEAEVPFHFMSGSDFVQMFVGVGAMRVRGLFDRAKSDAPCIIYIDELESVGSKRGLANSGGDREYQQTTGALLTEMDGFEKHPGVVVLASTNNPENLDEALLRPGRFDRRIIVPLPDANGRKDILVVHTRKTPLAEDVDLAEIALGTPGFSGADLANLVNEAALAASRESPPQEKVGMRHFNSAKDNVLIGLERKSLKITEEDKRRTAYHEIGHAVVALRTPGADPVNKVSIKPRGMALGVTMQLPTGDRHHYTRSFLESKLRVILGGRAAEEIFFDGDISVSAEDDIEKATEVSSHMVCRWGMSPLGPLTLKQRRVGAFLGGGGSGVYDCSSGLAFEADQAIKAIVMSALAAARRVLEEERETVKTAGEALLEREELTGEEISQILRGERLPPSQKAAPRPPNEASEVNEASETK